MTGVAVLATELVVKRLELLCQVAPQPTTVAATRRAFSSATQTFSLLAPTN